MVDVQAYRAALGRRIADVVGKYPTKTAASAVVDVTVEQLNKWIAGDVKVPVEALYRLAAHASVDFCWLCSGVCLDQNQETATVLAGPAPRIQPTTLRDVLTAVASVQAGGVVFDPQKFADMVFALHDYVASVRAKGDGGDIDLSAMTGIIKLASRG